MASLSGWSSWLCSRSFPLPSSTPGESTPQQYWSSPRFKRINLVLSAAWGAAIVALLPIAIIIYLLKFSKSYPDRVTHHESDAASRA